MIYFVHKGEDDEDDPPKYPWERPDGGFFKHVWWLLFFSNGDSILPYNT